MALIKDYAMIDHVGMLEGNTFNGFAVFKKDPKEPDAVSMNRAVYAYVNKRIEADGFEKKFSVKECAKLDSPYAREITSKMKTRIRYTKNPKKVYLICNSLSDNNANFAYKVWTERNIEVEVIEVHPFEIDHKIDVDGVYDKKRRIAEIWANALGWSFSAPITRIQQENSIDNYSKRSDHDELVAHGETHITKVSSRPESFLLQQRVIAPDAEIDAFIEHYMFYQKAVASHQLKLSDILEPGWAVCPHCGKPYRQHEGTIRCNYCDSVIDDDIIESAYFDDSFDDESYLD